MGVSMYQRSVVPMLARHAWRRVATVSLLLLALFILSTALAPANTSAAAASGPEDVCALLDDPAIREQMSGMFETRLLVQCGRSDELGKLANEPQPPAPFAPQVGVDVLVNDPTGESGSGTTQSETSI